MIFMWASIYEIPTWHTICIRKGNDEDVAKGGDLDKYEKETGNEA